MKPVILITHKFGESDFSVGGLYRCQSNYCRAVIAAGGIPVISAGADAEDYAALADGILFTGSNCDIDPASYGQENRGSADCDPALDAMELKLFDAFYRAGKPIFGICRGVQLISVALGGSLVQDIPQEIPDLSCHDAIYKKESDHHPVSVAVGTRLHSLFGQAISTNSFHHQSVKDPGRDMLVSALSADGVIEAIEHKSLPIFGVQWHPERMIGEECETLPNMLPLFRHFIDLCKK